MEAAALLFVSLSLCTVLQEVCYLSIHSSVTSTLLSRPCSLSLSLPKQPLLPCCFSNSYQAEGQGLLQLGDDVGRNGDGRIQEKQAAEHSHPAVAIWERAGGCWCCQGSPAPGRQCPAAQAAQARASCLLHTGLQPLTSAAPCLLIPASNQTLISYYIFSHFCNSVLFLL